MFGEISRVRLTKPFETPDGVTIPTGAEGVVLHIFKQGEAYMVEFSEYGPMPETIAAHYLEEAV